MTKSCLFCDTCAIKLSTLSKAAMVYRNIVTKSNNFSQSGANWISLCSFNTVHPQGCVSIQLFTELHLNGFVTNYHSTSRDAFFPHFSIKLLTPWTINLENISLYQNILFFKWYNLWYNCDFRAIVTFDGIAQFFILAPSRLVSRYWCHLQLSCRFWRHLMVQIVLRSKHGAHAKTLVYMATGD